MYAFLMNYLQRAEMKDNTICYTCQPTGTAQPLHASASSFEIPKE